MNDWEAQAENWVLWARTPGHDEYWRYRDLFHSTVVPGPGRLTLEVGCGEGRVARDLLSRGHHVVGVDTSTTLLRYADGAGTDARFALADGAALPFQDGSFDLVVAHNSLMDVDDMPGTVAEVARVLSPGGFFCASITHPFRDTVEFVKEGHEIRFNMTRPYFERQRFEGTAQRAGLTMTFTGWTYPLEDYARALAGSGLLIDLLREPRPGVETGANEGGDPLPLFLYFRALKPAT